VSGCKHGQHLVVPRNEIGNVLKGKFSNAVSSLGFVCADFGRKFGEVVKEKLVMLFRRFVLFARNVSRNRRNDSQDELGPKLEWPHVLIPLSQSAGLASGTSIWRRQHARWHHGYYRTRR